MSKSLEADGVCSRVSSEIAKTGFSHMTGTHDVVEFARVSESLGSIIWTTTVYLRENHHAMVFRSDPIMYHSDDATGVRIVGLHCVRQDKCTGTTFLLDISDLPAKVPRTTLETLKQTRIRVQKAGINFRELPYEPVFWEEANTWWLQLNAGVSPYDFDGEKRKALTILFNYIEREAKQRSHAIRLHPGESLWFDNRRMLHARDGIAHDSQRMLNRVWIATKPSLAIDDGQGTKL